MSLLVPRAEPHAYVETDPYTGCGKCGYGPGAGFHNSEQIAKHEQKSSRLGPRCTRCDSAQGATVGWLINGLCPNCSPPSRMAPHAFTPGALIYGVAGPSTGVPTCAWCGYLETAVAHRIPPPPAPHPGLLENRLLRARVASIEARTLLHRLWTKAVGTAGYEKSEWKQLEHLLKDLPNRVPQIGERHLAELGADKLVCSICGNHYHECDCKGGPHGSPCTRPDCVTPHFTPQIGDRELERREHVRLAESGDGIENLTVRTKPPEPGYPLDEDLLADDV